jgi:peptidoglycan/xylan/chitin deacetylase (PgdA/CDA1 family)
MSRTGLPILTYHALDSSPSVVSTDPDWFAETMRVLHSAGFRTVGLADWIADGRPSLDRTFALTFDDGMRSILRAADVLARHQFQATAFLVTDRMGHDNAWPGQPTSIPRSPLLRWNDVAELQAAGFQFGSHTRSHGMLNDCDQAMLETELRDSRAVLEDRIGAPCGLLAYPYGAASARVRQAAARWYAAAFGTRLAFASSIENLHFLSRVDAYYLRSYRAIERLVSGRWQSWLAARRALRTLRCASTVSTR